MVFSQVVVAQQRQTKRSRQNQTATKNRRTLRPKRVLASYVISYNSGKTAFSKKNYISAALYFYAAVNRARWRQKETLYQARQRDLVRQKSQYLLASSLFNLRLYYASAVFYDAILKEGKKSLFLKEAVRGLRRVNKQSSLYSRGIARSFHGYINARSVARAEKGFYHYFVGLYYFNQKSWTRAEYYFRKVDSRSDQFLHALYYLGILNTLVGDRKLSGANRHMGYPNAERLFLNVLNKTRGKPEFQQLRDMTLLNTARLYYELEEFRRAIRYYSQISRRSDSWLSGIFEASWAFFRMGKHNNTLGNIHTLQSPFYRERFFPESFILQSITYLQLCFHEEAHQALIRFQKQYQPMFSDIKRMVADHRNKPMSMYQTVRRFKVEKLTRYKKATFLIDSMSRTNPYKESSEILNRIHAESNLLDELPQRFRRSRLARKLSAQLASRRRYVVREAGGDLYKQLEENRAYLKDLSTQGQLIIVEALEGKYEASIKAMHVNPTQEDNTIWGDGMKPLRLKAVHEYWPFDGEYWQDELGGYVYNIESKCNQKESR